MNLHDLLSHDNLTTAMYVILAFGWDDALVALVLLVVSATITALTTRRPKTDPAVAASLTDFDIPQVDEGTAQTVVFGDVWLTGWNVLWYGNLRVFPIPAPKKGKK